MKKTALVLVLIMILSLAACGNDATQNTSSSTKETETATTKSADTEKEAEVEEVKAWAPSKNVNFYVASSPGGGSDMYSRAIVDVLSSEGHVDETIIVSNETDGGGSVIRTKIANGKSDLELLAFVSGAVRKMHKNEDIKITMDDFTPLAILAADKHLFFVTDDSPYQTAEDIIEAVKAGTKVVMGGSKSDDFAIYEAFIKEIGVTQDVLTYITYDASSEAIVSLLGGHVDFAISKPGAAMEYVKSGDMKPVLAMSTSRFPAPLDEAPILSDLGYENVEMPTWRGVVGAKNMSPEAVQFWSDALKEAAKSEAWIEYMNKNLLIPMYMDNSEAKAYIKDYEDMIIEGLKK